MRPSPGIDLPPTCSCQRRWSSAVPAAATSTLAIFCFGNISLSFDPTFRDVPLTVDLRGAALDSALRADLRSTQTNFYRVTGARSGCHSRHARKRRGCEEVVRTISARAAPTSGDDGPSAWCWTRAACRR